MEDFTDTLPEEMPSAAELIGQIRERMTAGESAAYLERVILEQWPALDLLAPIPVLAEWLKVKEASIYMSRTRSRPDGSRVWPDEDATILGRKMWRFITVLMSRATAPGRGWNLRSDAREGAR